MTSSEESQGSLYSCQPDDDDDGGNEELDQKSHHALRMKHLVFNKYLPYADVIDEEATLKLIEIKENLGRAVALRELKPGCFYWSLQLSTYICLHGVKLSTEDHLLFINLFYELVTIPDLEVFLVQHFSQVLTALLTKRNYISREELILQWRPLYQVYERICLNRKNKLQMIRIPNGANVAVVALIRVARTYFPVEATLEMLEEWRPWFCPFVRKQTKKAMDCFELFLPVVLYKHEHVHGFRLWFDEFTQIWMSCDTFPMWDLSMTSLFSRLAVENVGYIDWNPIIPTIFTRLLRSLQLPVFMNHIRLHGIKDLCNMTAISNWLVSMLGGNSRCQANLDQLFKTLQSFYHPSNTGAWNIKLHELLSKLSFAMIKRLSRERKMKKTWLPDIPHHCRLTDDDITRFVLCLKPCVLLAMFGKSGCKDAAMALKDLSLIKPEIIVPSVLERFYPAVETLTEPHRLLAIIKCLSHVVVALIGSSKCFPEGPSHVLPILNCCLPAIDPNDLTKTRSTFQLLVCLLVQIPLRDVSQLVSVNVDLSMSERELCMATCQFEDFVLRFLDRCFVLVENSSPEASPGTDSLHNSVTAEVEQLQEEMCHVFQVILMQSSQEILQSAVRKLHNFVTGRIMGIKDAGYLAAKLVHATVAKGSFSVDLFLPGVCRVIEANFVDLESTSSHPGNEILFNMLLLQEIVCCDGQILLPYSSTLKRVLTKIISLTDKDGHDIACSILRNLLSHLTTIYYSECGDCEAENITGLPAECWGRTVNLRMKISWHTGSVEETAFAQDLVDTFLLKEMESLRSLCEGSATLSREQLQQSLMIVHSTLLGCLSLCPPWDDSKIPVVNSVVATEAIPYTTCMNGVGILKYSNGKNLRKEVAVSMSRLIRYLLKNNEDNTIAFQRIIKIYFRLLFYWGTHYETWQGDWEAWKRAKKIMQNPFQGKNRHFRMLFIQRVLLQHHMRTSEFGLNSFSELHKVMMIDLLTLSLSRYAKVRVPSQWLLGECFKVFIYSYQHLMPELAVLVQNATDHEHHKLKGLLHVLLGNQVSYCLLTRRDWKTLLALWPIVVKTTISDKLSINVLLDTLVDKVKKQLDTFAICETVTESAIGIALSFWTSLSKTMPCPVTLPTSEEISDAVKRSSDQNAANLKLYEEIVSNQVTLLDTSKLHWQNQQLGLEMLSFLIRHDLPFPVPAVPVMLHGLICDLPASRKVALPAVVRILEQVKPQMPHVEVEPLKIAGEGNALLFYDSENIPSTNDAWDATFFVDKPYLGFYRWPKVLKLHVPSRQHAERWKIRSKMSKVEGILYDFFVSSCNMDKLVQYLSAEGNKDQDKLDMIKCHLFKHLFRNFGEVLVPLFKEHLERLVTSSRDCDKRCGLEIMAGLVAGSKHWTYDMLHRLWAYLTPLMRLALSHVSVEIQNDWSRGISYMMNCRDPRRMKWLLDLLLEDILASNEGSFFEANRLFLLVVALSEQPWRLPSVLDNVLDIVRPHLAHPYQNIRDELGRVLSQLFLTNDELRPFPSAHRGPLQRVFVDEIFAELETFEKAMAVMGAESVSDSVAQVMLSEDDPKWKSSVALLKTVCHWLRRRITKSLQWTFTDLFRLFNVLCQGITCDRDPELQSNCRIAIAILAHSFLTHDHLSAAVKTIVATSHSNSWRLRRTCVEFIQVLFFTNLFTVLEHQQCLEMVRETVLRLLQDVKPEVQQVAALALSGMFHSEIFKVDHVLLNHFVSLSKTSIKKKGQPTGDALQLRHAGILGLCAFVGARPYDVIDGMPEVLVTLGDHLHDPQPLQSTVRKALTNFWRTHRDNWHDHKLKFSDDQLAVLTDFLVSPNYYA